MDVCNEYLPKYRRIKELIKSRIGSGYYKRGQKLKPRLELAREFNTTLATCSRAIDELLAEKELDSKIGTGTFVADVPAAQKFQVYAIVRTLNNPFYGKFADTLGQVLEQKGFLPSKIISSQYDPEKEAGIVREILNENNTLIVMCGFISPKTREMVLEQPERFYLYGNAPELEGKANLITADQEEGAFISVNHLIEMGHLHIGIIAGTSQVNFKINGYRKALTGAGIKLTREYESEIYPENDNLPQEELNAWMNTVIDSYLQCKAVPSAVFCGSDFIAVNFISACQMRGLKVPDDFSVCGYGGAFDGYTGACRITTAIPPLKELFMAAADHFAAGGNKAFLNLKMPPELREGNTVKNINERTK